MATATLSRPKRLRKSGVKESPYPIAGAGQSPARTMRVPFVGKPPSVGDNLFIDPDDGHRPNSVTAAVGVIRRVQGRLATVRLLGQHPLSKLIQELAADGHTQIEHDALPDLASRRVLRLRRPGASSASVQESLATTTLFESVSMATATSAPSNAFGQAIGQAIANVAMNTKLSRAKRLKKIGKLIDVSDQFANFSVGDSAVQEDDDTEVEEDGPRTPGDNGPLAESYRGSPARRSLLEHLGRAPASRSDNLLNFLGRGPQRDAAVNSLLASLGRR